MGWPDAAHVAWERVARALVGRALIAGRALVGRALIAGRALVGRALVGRALTAAPAALTAVPAALTAAPAALTAAPAALTAAPAALTAAPAALIAAPAEYCLPVLQQPAIPGSKDPCCAGREASLQCNGFFGGT
jgi:hypothetical protein